MSHELKGLLTTAQLAAFLCVSTSAVRHMARDHGLSPVGKSGQANLYHAASFVKAVGVHDRSVNRKRRPSPAKITPEAGSTLP